MTAPFNRAAIEAHVTLIHKLAEGCDGALTLVSIEEGKTPRVRRFGVGQTTLMVDAIMGSEVHPGLNVYMPWAVMRRDLEPNKKGREFDIVAVLGAVSDLDHDKYSIGELPLKAPYVVESSVGNYQAIYPFTRPLSVSEAKPIVPCPTQSAEIPRLRIARTFGAFLAHGTTQRRQSWRAGEAPSLNL